MKLKEVLESVSSINVLMEQKIQVRIAYKLALFIDKLQPFLNAFNEQKLKLLNEFGTPQKTEGPDKLFNFETDVKREGFEKEINELLDQEIDIEVPKFNIEDFDNVKLSTSEVAKITWLFN